MSLLSFIIPAHNAADTLAACVESICLDEGFADLCEVILVENGSADETLLIAKQLAEKYNITAATSETGVSRARNEGLRLASGKYIIFVDADDLWIRGSIKKIVKDIENKPADLFVYSYMKGKSGAVYFNEKDAQRVDYTGASIREGKNWIVSRPTQRMTVWAKVFSKSVIDEIQLRFDEDLNFSEDSNFVIRFLKHCREISVFRNAIYQYNTGGGSAIRAYDNSRRTVQIRALEKSVYQLNQDEQIGKNSISEFVLIHLNLILVRDVFNSDRDIRYRIRNKEMKELLKMDLFKQAIKNIPLTKCLSPQLIPEAFFKTPLCVMGGVICYAKNYLNHRQENR